MEYHSLLDYRPLDRLERMSDEDRVALLHEVLRGGPSENAWRAVFELFALWRHNDAKRRALESADLVRQGREGIPGFPQIPAAADRPPPVANARQSASAPVGARRGARTLTM